MRSSDPGVAALLRDAAAEIDADPGDAEAARIRAVRVRTVAELFRLALPQAGAHWSGAPVPRD